MTRSFVHRRRHRHLIEEAIHNGWIPPEDGREFGELHGVDRRKEPKIWEVFIKGKSVVGSGRVDAEWDWDSIKPLSATTTQRSSSQKISLYSDSLSRLISSVSPLTERERMPHYLGIANRSPPLPESNTPTKSSTSAPKPRSIVVATLIAMPSRARSLRMSTHFNQSRPSYLLSTNPPSVPPPLLKSEECIISTPSLIHSSLPSPSSLVPEPQQATGKLPSEGAEPLPHVEFGIVELLLGEERHKEGSYHVA